MVTDIIRLVGRGGPWGCCTDSYGGAHSIHHPAAAYPASASGMAFAICRRARGGFAASRRKQPSHDRLERRSIWLAQWRIPTHGQLATVPGTQQPLKPPGTVRGSTNSSSEAESHPNCWEDHQHPVGTALLPGGGGLLFNTVSTWMRTSLMSHFVFSSPALRSLLYYY
ncbi:hypothetical protein RJ55_02791 [Drechmeria coniospora]|nr:hypothetical protein RJ55_02791 [Drechmeria coniospora]